MGGKQRHPDGRRHGGQSHTRRRKPGERRSHGLGNALGPAGVCTVQHEEELVAAEANGCVSRANCRGQHAGGVTEGDIADGVAAGVVDALEVVEVHEQYRQLRPRAHRLCGLPRGQLVPPSFVEQSGQLVGDDALLQLVVELGIAPGRSRQVPDEGAAFDVLVAELVQAIAPDVENTETMVAGDQGNHDDRLVEATPGAPGHMGRLDVGEGIAAVVRVASEERPTGDACPHEIVHVVETFHALADEDPRTKRVGVPIRLEDRQSIDPEHSREKLGDGLEDVPGIVLGLQAAGSFPERPGEGTVVLGCDCGRHPGVGHRSWFLVETPEHPDGTLSKPRSVHDLVPRLRD